MKEKMYQVAIDTHKFYDEVSMKLVAGIIVVTGAAFLISDKTSLTGNMASAFFLVVALITLGLLIKFKKTSYYAGVARNVSAEIEENGTLIGISTVYKNPKKHTKFHVKKVIGYNIYGAVHFVWAACFFGLVLSAYFVN